MRDSHRFSSLLMDIGELNPVRNAGVVRLPELVGVPFPARVKAIVDHPYFQRLRKVRQLSLTYLVYPGATHTRFEHSLGVFETTTRYLTALLTNRRCAFVVDGLTKGAVEALLLAALLHDIGHYSFAHLLEDWVGGAPDHAELMHAFISGDIAASYPSLQLPPGTKSLAAIIASEWPDVDIDDVVYFVSGAGRHEKYTADSTWPLLRSILDGPMDADKMDYLYRDSLHCGVPYGRFIDRDRFFQSLAVAEETPDRIAIHEKGRICVELFGYARSAMYSEVYWHHSSRAVTAMLNRAFTEALCSESSPESARATLLDRVFGHSDEEIVEWLSGSEAEGCRDIMQMMHARRLYKRLMVIHKPSHPTLFEMLDRLKWQHPQRFERLSEALVVRINRQGLLSRPDGMPLMSHDLLVDVPRFRAGLPDVPIIQEYDERSTTPNDNPGVWSGIKQDFERWVRKIRVFRNPDLKIDVDGMAGSNKLSDRLIGMLSECAWELLQSPENRQ